MKRYFASMMSLALVTGLVIPSFGAPAKEKKGKKQGQATPVAAVEEQLSSLDLTSEQKEKADKILANYKKKFSEGKDAAADLTKDQRKAKKQAMTQAKTDGKKAKEAREAANSAAQLTDEQKKAIEKNAAKTKELQASLKKELADVLTAEQAGKVTIGGGKKKKNS